MVSDPAATCPSLARADLIAARNIPVRSLGFTEPEAHLQAVNRLLHNPTLAMASPIAAAAAAHLSPDGTLDAARASDAEVWVHQEGQWVSLFPAERFAPEGSRFYTDQVRAATTQAARWDAHVELFEHHDWCLSDMVGVRPRITFQTANATAGNAVVVATDGAELTPAALDGLDEHLRYVQTRVPRDGHPFPCGDFAVVSLARTD